MTNNNYDALALFSGGLDSILAALTIQEQGLKVKCIHYTTPFFGFPEKIEHWKSVYNLDIEAVDIGEDYATMLQDPTYGYGSTLNPCVDCKILMMNKTRELLSFYNASFIISGEVLGQRPMSQRRDTLNVIKRDADIKDILLRPLCAHHMDETKPEREGLVDRTLLHNFSGRGRQPQLDLAEKLGVKDIPTPAGGCRLTEKDASARYLQVMTMHTISAENFALANIGRQFWHTESNDWLVIGRNKDDNQSLENLQKENDVLMRVNGFPSPLGLIRPKLHDKVFTNDFLSQAASMLASYSPKAVEFSKKNNDVEVIIYKNETQHTVTIRPLRGNIFAEPDWKTLQSDLKKRLKSKNTNT